MAFAQSVEVLLIGRSSPDFGTGAVAGPATAALVELDPMRDGKKAAITATAAVTVARRARPHRLGRGAGDACGADADPLCPAGGSVAGQRSCLGLAALARGDAATPCDERRRFDVGGFGPLLREAGLPFAIACFGMALAWMVGGTFVALGPSFAHRLVGIDSKALAGLTVSAFQIAAGITPIFTRQLSSRQALAGGAVMMSASLCLCAVAAAWGSAALFCIATLLHRLAGTAPGFAGRAGLANRSAPARGRSSLVSLSYAAGYIGNLVPVIAMGMVIDHFGLFTALAAGAATAAVFTLVLVLACLRIRER